MQVEQKTNQQEQKAQAEKKDQIEKIDQDEQGLETHQEEQQCHQH